MKSLEKRIWEWAFEKMEDGDVILYKFHEPLKMTEEFSEFIEYILQWTDNDIYNFDHSRESVYHSLTEREVWSIFNSIKITEDHHAVFIDKEYERIFRGIFNEYMFRASGAKKEMDDLEELIPGSEKQSRKSTRI